MTDIDIVAELRRLYEAATGDDTRPWERIKKHDRVLGHPIYHGDPENEGVGVAFTLRAADLIVAMHNHLPALLDAIDTLSWYADERNYNEDGIPGIESRFAPDGWLKDYGERARVAVALLKLLKLLKRSDG